MGKLYTRRQAAERLGKHYTTIRRWEDSGRINVDSYVGEGATREPRFTEEEIQRVLDVEGEDAQTPPQEWAALLAAATREIEILRQDLDRERSLVDTLLQREKGQAK